MLFKLQKLNTMSKEKAKKHKTKMVLEMPVVNLYAAGIDIGDKEIVVALPEGVSAQRVHTFGTMTCDLHALAGLLADCEIDTAAMEVPVCIGSRCFRCW